MFIIDNKDRQKIKEKKNNLNTTTKNNLSNISYIHTCVYICLYFSHKKESTISILF